MAANETSENENVTSAGRTPRTRVSALQAGVGFLQRNAQRILAMLLVTLVVLTVFSCFVIGSLGVGGGSGWLGTPAPGGISGYDATATYGADLFYLQLTAVAPQGP